ncbi:MAG: crotonase/enoyl-CoA hydratase family protein [Myxococcales bacterium]|nr:crotonase/enoyl-CoA hydratase family protein [Myxococcales bacterium]
MSEPLSYRVDREVAVITMDDGKANALGPSMLRALDEALGRAEQEGRAVVLAGRAGKFCAGFDLKVMMSAPTAARDLVLDGAKLFLRLFEHPRPVVIACTGHAVAGGALLVLCGDLRVGTEGPFMIGLNEVAIGLTLPRFAVELARERLSPRAMGAATVLATMYAPNDAANAGYLDEVVEADAVLERAISEAQRLGALPAATFAGTKQRVRETAISRMREAVKRDAADMDASLS